MRDIDRIECAALGRSPKQALRQGLIASTEAWTAKLDGIPHAMFGIVHTSLIDREAMPWFLGSDETYRHPREMLIFGTRLVAHWLDSSELLSNVIMTANVRAIRLLKRWGFTVGDEERMIGGHAFLDFWVAR